MNLSESWILQVDPSVFKVLKKVPQHDAEGILPIIQLLLVDPYYGDIQKLKGEDNVWRRRIGSFRLFYKLYPTESILFIFRLERRVSKTY